MIFVMALVVAMFAAAILDVYGVVVSVPVFASAVGVVWYGITQRQSGGAVPPRHPGIAPGKQRVLVGGRR
ncbi:hypothetical protein APR12_004727 [Nocardia amikacinitolerans]|uniref:hypothetical protein n=1 Tax=Nocardia amikacinitolerans TaxID=756689 RepID=UPI00082B9529|nr:hypothetical protein [Nocardia amikacinitolerans]MCP2319359.1 hypothetical protein [Nocardia amikacinitolerans]